MMPKKNKFYVTTPIYYINDQAHIGHAYSTIAADVLARYYRQQNRKVLFTTGTDENSQKTLEAAKTAKLNTKEYSDKTAKKWQNLWDQLNISYDRFIRTTEPAHIKAVQTLIQKIYDKGDIYKGIYEGLYCFRCEAFYREDDLIDGKCPFHKIRPEFIKEENYFFKLSKYQDDLLNYIKNNPHFILPEARHNEVVAFIERGLDDISISRANQKWGVPLPFDKSQVTYVWFDALINYLTVADYPDKKYSQWWPADVHIIGKDIIRFHCVIWPAMLISAGIELPKTIFAHGFFTVDGEKISKSLGNAIDPIELTKKYGNDALRYYLLREFPFGTDGDFSHERFKIVYETELGDNLGNLVQRLVIMLEKYNERGYSYIQPKNRKILQNIKEQDHNEQFLKSLEFSNALQTIFKWIDHLNIELANEEPWKLIKQDKVRAIKFLNEVVSGILDINEYLKPFLPETAEKILKTFKNGKVNTKIGILFPKIDNAD
ncbi:MAG: methionine--tRNA ligase [bacterium]|nr:methionine--tRNA ligase [bacterium]